MILANIINSILKPEQNNSSKNQENKSFVPSSKKQSERIKSPNDPNFYASVFGVKTKSLDKMDNGIEGLFNALKRISDKSSDFCKMNIKSSKFSFNLKYPRSDFIKDVYMYASMLPESEQEKIWEFFDFRLEKNLDGIRMKGFPLVPKNAELSSNHYSQITRETINKIGGFVRKFTDGNEISPDENTVTKQAADDMNSILKAVPELYSIIGTKQHYSHDFTLDVHTFSVLQEVIKNPMFENLSDEDKKVLMFSSILHDIEKTEGVADVEHPSKSAEKALSIAERMGFSSQNTEKIYKLIKNHNLLEKCNKAYPEENQDSLISFYAGELKEGSLLEMEQILTKADLLCTKENDKSYYKYKGAYDSIFAKLFSKRNLLY